MNVNFKLDARSEGKLGIKGVDGVESIEGGAVTIAVACKMACFSNVSNYLRWIILGRATHRS